LRRFLLCLHRPLASRVHVDTAYYFSRKISLDAAMTLLAPMPDQAFSHLLSVGAGMFKNRMIHVATALAAELLREVEENGPSAEPTACRKIVVDAAKEALRQSKERIRLGSTNSDVKTHMKLSMAICQGEAISGDAASLRNLAQAALDSVQISYSTLQARVGQLDEVENAAHILDGDQLCVVDHPFEFDDLFGPFEFGTDDGLASDAMFMQFNASDQAQ
jgi:hypothetical protein